MFRQKSNQSSLGLSTHREGSLKFLLTLRPAALISTCHLKSGLWIFAEVSKLRVGEVFSPPFLISLVTERVVVIIAFYSQAILLSE